MAALIKRWVFVGLCLTATSVVAQEETAVAAIERFHTDLGAMVLEPDTVQRAEFIEPRIRALFDLERIARFSLGRTWRDLDTADRDRFVAALGRQMALTYADRFGLVVPAFSEPTEQTLKNGTLVSSTIRSKQGEDVTLDYFFRDGRVFNVAADGVSDLSLRRADYGRIVKDEGFSALLTHLRAQIRELESKD